MKNNKYGWFFVFSALTSLVIYSVFSGLKEPSKSPFVDTSNLPSDEEIREDWEQNSEDMADLAQTSSSIEYRGDIVDEIPLASHINSTWFNDEDICEAATSLRMGRNTLDMLSEKIYLGDDSDFVEVSYTRDDGTFWVYKCRIIGDQIDFWNSAKEEWGSILSMGDAKYTFLFPDPETLLITEKYPDNSQTTKRFGKALGSLVPLD